MQGGELIPLESGQFVRLRMTRSNPIPLGIPFDQEWGNETIQADALLSNDGLARNPAGLLTHKRGTYEQERYL